MLYVTPLIASRASALWCQIVDTGESRRPCKWCSGVSGSRHWQPALQGTSPHAAFACAPLVSLQTPHPEAPGPVALLPLPLRLAAAQTVRWARSLRLAPMSRPCCLMPCVAQQGQHPTAAAAHLPPCWPLHWLPGPPQSCGAAWRWQLFEVRPAGEGLAQLPKTSWHGCCCSKLLKLHAGHVGCWSPAWLKHLPKMRCSGLPATQSPEGTLRDGLGATESPEATLTLHARRPISSWAWTF